MPLCRKQSRRSRDAPIIEAGTNIALGHSKNFHQYTPRVKQGPASEGDHPHPGSHSPRDPDSRGGTLSRRRCRRRPGPGDEVDPEEPFAGNMEASPGGECPGLRSVCREHEALRAEGRRQGIAVRNDEDHLAVGLFERDSACRNSTGVDELSPKPRRTLPRKRAVQQPIVDRDRFIRSRGLFDLVAQDGEPELLAAQAGNAGETRSYKKQESDQKIYGFWGAKASPDAAGASDSCGRGRSNWACHGGGERLN
jgi:hypothetical protein